MKPAKCHLLKKSVHYLRHVVSEKEIEADPEKVKCIRDWPIPMSSKELCQFVSMAYYYRKFVKDFAKIAVPLHTLVDKGKVWSWTEQCEQAFNTLKHHLTSTPILILPRYNQELILDVDASGKQFSTRSLTARNALWHMPAGPSQRLKGNTAPPGERYWGVRQYRPYIYGQSFTVRTDHNALRWLQIFQDPEGRVARWLEILSEYNFKVIHCPGPRHGNADALSWLPCKQCGKHAHNGGREGC